MSQARLVFEDDEFEFAPNRMRPTPSFWIKKLVVFNETEDDLKVIREIDFRLGLNIINTEKPDNEFDGAVGHDVGKTLLTRLIRYCLGETHYARESTRQRIGEKLLDSWVAAQFCVRGDDLIVIRPLGKQTTNMFWAVMSNNWREAFHSNAKLTLRDILPTLLRALYDSDEEHLKAEKLILPYSARQIRWLDVLAWLSRDQNCRYRRPMEWRSKFAESKTLNLHESDAGVLVRHLMALLDDEEIKLIKRHRKLLKECSDYESRVRELEASTTQVRSFLSRRLQMDCDQLTFDLFAEAAMKQLEEQHAKAKGHRDSIEKRYGLETLREERDAANARLIGNQKETELTTTMAKSLELRIRELAIQSDELVKKAMAKKANLCPEAVVGKCPLSLATNETRNLDAFRKHELDERTEEFQRVKGTLSELEIRRKDYDSKLQSATATLHGANEKADKERDSLTKQLSRIELEIEEAKSLKADYAELTETMRSFKAKEIAVKKSRDRQREVRDELKQRHDLLNRHLRRVFEAITKQPSSAWLKIDMNGIRILPNGDDRDSGEAIASETALVFDIACLSASICGIGILPRFMIHDSPREGDLEPHIYERLFYFIRELELDANDEPNFQYIVATTTPPPKKLNKKPYVRLTLDRRDVTGLLLKTEF